MPFRYEVHPGCCIHVAFTGALTSRSLLACFAAVRHDPAASSELPRLIDLRAVRRIPSAAALRGLAHVLCREETGPVQRAFLLPPGTDPTAFHVFEAASAECAGTSRSFQSLPEAAAWLGVALPAGIA